VTSLESFSPSDLASILDEDPPFIALLVHDVAEETFLKDLSYALDLIPNSTSLILTKPSESVRGLIAEMAKSAPQFYCIANLNEFTSTQFEELDKARSQFVAERIALLVLNEVAMHRFLSSAPNLLSFIGAKIYSALPDIWTLTTEQKSNRLSNLRSSFGMSDEELVGSVEESKIDLSPSVVDWLILLDRGDLIP